MKKKVIIPLVLLVVLLMGGIGWLAYSLHKEKQENQDMVKLADMDKHEMENQYQDFANQYSEMQTQISNDTIIAQLAAEQDRTERLLRELKNTKATDAREIARLKKELATVRAVLRSYVLQIDSLNKVNQNLTEENTRIKGQYAQATQQIEGLNTEKASLSEKVAIASQLDAVNVTFTGTNKRGKTTDKVSKVKTLQVGFTIAKNVTAAAGAKTVYIQIQSPTGTVLGGGGNFSYEGRTLQATAARQIEYGGKDTPVQLYWPVSQALTPGTYRVSIFADGNMIGSRTLTLK